MSCQWQNEDFGDHIAADVQIISKAKSIHITAKIPEYTNNKNTTTSNKKPIKIYNVKNRNGKLINCTQYIISW